MNEALSITGIHSVFISFVFGRRLRATLFSGFNGTQQTASYCCDTQNVPQYDTVRSWLPTKQTPRINKLWNSFVKKWNESEDANDVLERVIFWYNQANSSHIALEERFILGVAALEVMFNILKDENKGIKGLNGKIQFLCDYAGVKDECASEIKEIRDCLVHYGKKNREIYATITTRESTQYLWKIVQILELLLLRYLNYQGVYCDRTANIEWEGQGCSLVPWVNSTQG